MSSATEALSEQLAAEIELIEHRLEDVQARIAESSEAVQQKFDARAKAIWVRAEQFRTSTHEWLNDPYLSSTAAEDLSHAVDALAADLDAAIETNADAFRAVVDRQLRTWRTRAERLRVQEALAEMEIRDELSHVSDRLRSARADALVQLRHVGGEAKDAAQDFWDDLEDLIDDVRDVVDRAVDSLTDGEDDG